MKIQIKSSFHIFKVTKRDGLTRNNSSLLRYGTIKKNNYETVKSYPVETKLLDIYLVGIGMGKVGNRLHIQEKDRNCIIFNCIINI